MWKNVVESDRPQVTIWCMRISCWVPKATDKHSEYVILLLFHCNNENLIASLHVYCLSFIVADTRTKWQ